MNLLGLLILITYDPVVLNDDSSTKNLSPREVPSFWYRVRGVTHLVSDTRYLAPGAT
jgi:hypothetical protein